MSDEKFGLNKEKLEIWTAGINFCIEVFNEETTTDKPASMGDILRRSQNIRDAIKNLMKLKSELEKAAQDYAIMDSEPSRILTFN